MNTLEYYDRQKEFWGDNEVQEIRTEYQAKDMNISEIADIGELEDIVIPLDTLKFDGKCTFDYKRKQQSIWQKIKKVFGC